MEIKLANSAGFCFGVKRAVDLVYDEVAKNEGKIYTYGPTIHNEEVKETRESRLVKEEPKVVEKKKPRLEELLTKIEDATEELDKTLPIGVLEDRVKLENFDDEDEGVSDKTITDTTLEHDLFNLIDSMYDDKED